MSQGGVCGKTVYVAMAVYVAVAVYVAMAVYVVKGGESGKVVYVTRWPVWQDGVCGNGSESGKAVYVGMAVNAARRCM